MAEDDQIVGDNDGDWDSPVRDGDPDAGAELVVDVEGFEGPLDLLLAMARTQKVDLARISVLQLVEQYLAFIAEVQKLKLELAADYLVMAAWLAFLKSRLLLPKEVEEGDQATAEEMAQRLAFRLMRLEAMRNAAAQLMTRGRLGRDIFARGSPESVKTLRDTHYTADLNGLLKAYAVQRQRTIKVTHVVKARRVWSIKDARERLEQLFGKCVNGWVQLEGFLREYLPGGEDEKTVKASSFGATLEMAREGILELRQDSAFAPLYIRRRGSDDEWQKIG